MCAFPLAVSCWGATACAPSPPIRCTASVQPAGHMPARRYTPSIVCCIRNLPLSTALLLHALLEFASGPAGSLLNRRHTRNDLKEQTYPPTHPTNTHTQPTHAQQHNSLHTTRTTASHQRKERPEAASAHCRCHQTMLAHHSSGMRQWDQVRARGCCGDMRFDMLLRRTVSHSWGPSASTCQSCG